MSIDRSHNVLATRPWHDANVPEEFALKSGMIRIREAALLYYLARDYYVGAGEIVDAGAFLGASSHFLARGLHDNPRVRERQGRIHAYDKFIADEDYIVDFLRAEEDPEFPREGSFIDYFERTVGAHLDYVTIWAGDLLAQTWLDRDVELLFVDIAKSPLLNRFVMEQFYTRLIPGRSVVVHQDYHHPYLPHIHISMEILASYFEIIDEKIDDSILFRNTARIPAAAIEAAAAETLTCEQGLSLMERAIERLSPANRPVAALARAYLLRGRFADQEAFERELRLLDERYRDVQDDHWLLYRNRMEAMLREAPPMV
jgi:hypothetical protein